MLIRIFWDPKTVRWGGGGGREEVAVKEEHYTQMQLRQSTWMDPCV